jgi:NAD-specific glutamate dehydrogenase
MTAARAGQSGVESISALLEARATIAGVFELVDLARSGNRPLEEVAAACVKLDAGFDFAWLTTAIDHLPAGNRWQARARAQLASELRALRQSLLQRDIADDAAAMTAARGVIEELKRNAPQDLAMLSSGLIEIRRQFNA